MSRSTVENQDVIGPFSRSPTAKPLRVADPRSLPRGQIKTLSPRLPSCKTRLIPVRLRHDLGGVVR